MSDPKVSALPAEVAVTPSSTTSVETTGSQQKKNVPVGQSQNKGKKPLTEPKKPAIDGVKSEYYPKSGETAISIANNNHITREELLKANPGMDENKLYETKAIKVPYRTEKNWNKYQAELKAYQAQQDEIREQKTRAEEAQRAKENAAKLRAKNENANALVKQAKDLGYGKSYTFTVDKKTGNIIVQLKEDKKLGDIRKNFRLPRGHLREMNPNITKKYEAGTIYDIDTLTRINDWDSAKVKKGDTFIINSDYFNPSKGFWKDFLGL